MFNNSIDTKEIFIRPDGVKIRDLTQTMFECFNSYPGFCIPCDIYSASINNNIISCAVVSSSQNILNIPSQFNDGYLIYNVCTLYKYRRKGLAKSILIMLINDLLTLDPKCNIYLEVDIQNTIAYDLYSSLRFEKVGKNEHKNVLYHIMKFVN